MRLFVLADGEPGGMKMEANDLLHAAGGGNSANDASDTVAVRHEQQVPLSNGSGTSPISDSYHVTPSRQQRVKSPLSSEEVKKGGVINRQNTSGSSKKKSGCLLM